MKKIQHGIIYFLGWIYSIQAQTLYSTIPAGADGGGDAIIKFTPGTNDLIYTKSFENSPYYAVGDLLKASDGKLLE